MSIMKQQDFLLKWIESGHVSIPMLFLQHYRNLDINETEALFLLHVHAFLSKGDFFPTPTDFSNVTTFSPNESMEMIQRLIRKGLLDIKEKEENNIRLEYYTLEPLWKKIMIVTEKETMVETKPKEEQINVFVSFEKEFARPLTPMECEMIAKWLDEDQYGEKIILEALKEAVFSNKLSFRYIDRILFEWGKRGIQTIEQIKEHTKQFHKNQMIQKQKNQLPKTESNIQPIANWLDL